MGKMNVSHMTASERIQMLVDRALFEKDRPSRGPVFHLLARMWELDHDVEAYLAERQNNHTTSYGKGARHSLAFAIQLVMKFRHKIPGITEDEIDMALENLKDANAFIGVRKEHLPVAA